MLNFGWAAYIYIAFIHLVVSDGDHFVAEVWEGLPKRVNIKQNPATARQSYAR